MPVSSIALAIGLPVPAIARERHLGTTPKDLGQQTAELCGFSSWGDIVPTPLLPLILVRTTIYGHRPNYRGLGATTSAASKQGLYRPGS